MNLFKAETNRKSAVAITWTLLFLLQVTEILGKPVVETTDENGIVDNTVIKPITKVPIILQENYPQEIYHSQDDYGEIECVNCIKTTKKRNIELDEDFLKYYFELDPNLQFNKRKAIFMTRGWGAGGMPFNVLYNPNQRLYKPDRVFKIAEPIALPLAEPLTDSYSNERKYDQQQIKKQYQDSQKYPHRKHYSVIPQLFVSYGWGPLGK